MRVHPFPSRDRNTTIEFAGQNVVEDMEMNEGSFDLLSEDLADDGRTILIPRSSIEILATD